MSRALAIVTLIVALTDTLPAAADEGELLLGGGAAIDAALLRHPLVAEALVLDASTAVTPMPRMRVDARYGLTNELHVGVGLEAAAATNVITSDAPVGGALGQIITGGYFEIAAPLGATWRLDSGYDVSVAVSLDAAPLMTIWSANALADPTKLDESGRPVRLPIELGDKLAFGGLLRLGAHVEARLFETLALRLGPALSVAWAQTPSARVALSLEGHWLAPAGPH